MLAVERLPGGPILATWGIPGSRSLTMSFMFRIGAVHESRNNAGLTHLAEHLLLSGSKGGLPVGLLLEEIGGQFNGATSKEYTHFWCKAIPTHLERILDSFSAILDFDNLSPEAFERERGVVSEEIRMYRTQPQIWVNALLDRALWADHPLGRFIGGTESELAGISPETVALWMEGYRSPANLIIGVAGKFDRDEVRDAIQRRFSLSGALIHNPPSPPSHMEYGPLLQIEEFRAPSVNLRLGFRFYSSEVTRATLEMLTGILNIRLFRRLRAQHGLAYALTVKNQTYLEANTLLIGINHVDPKNINRVKEAILEEIPSVSR